MDQNCSNKSGSEIAYLKSWNYVHPSQLALLYWITKQPISIAVDASMCWDSYSGGVINATNCPSALDPPMLDHGVIAVGFDLRGPQPYFLVRNSWGTGWGEAGYVKIAINMTHSGGLVRPRDASLRCRMCKLESQISIFYLRLARNALRDGQNSPGKAASNSAR